VIQLLGDTHAAPGAQSAVQVFCRKVPGLQRPGLACGRRGPWLGAVEHQLFQADEAEQREAAVAAVRFIAATGPPDPARNLHPSVLLTGAGGRGAARVRTDRLGALPLEAACATGSRPAGGAISALGETP